MQLTSSNCDVLVAIRWNSWGCYITMHGDRHLRGIWELFCADFHVASVDEDVARVESALMVLVSRMRSKD
jgi:hypothetical protein